MDPNVIMLGISCKNGVVGKFSVVFEVRKDQRWIDIVLQPPIHGNLTDLMKDADALVEMCGLWAGRNTSVIWTDTVAETITKCYPKGRTDMKLHIRKRLNKNVGAGVVVGHEAPELGQELLQDPNVDQGGHQEPDVNMDDMEDDMARVVIRDVRGAVEIDSSDQNSGINIIKQEAPEYVIDTDAEEENYSTDEFRGRSPTGSTTSTHIHAQEEIDHQLCQHLRDRFSEMSDQQIYCMIKGYRKFATGAGNEDWQMKNGIRYSELLTFLRILFLNVCPGSGNEFM